MVEVLHILCNQPQFTLTHWSGSARHFWKPGPRLFKLSPKPKERQINGHFNLSRYLTSTMEVILICLTDRGINSYSQSAARSLAGRHNGSKKQYCKARFWSDTSLHWRDYTDLGTPDLHQHEWRINLINVLNQFMQDQGGRMKTCHGVPMETCYPHVPSKLCQDVTVY